MIDLEVTEERLRKKDITLTAAPVINWVRGKVSGRSAGNGRDSTY